MFRARQHARSASQLLAADPQRRVIGNEFKHGFTGRAGRKGVKLRPALVVVVLALRELPPAYQQAGEWRDDVYGKNCTARGATARSASRSDHRLRLSASGLRVKPL